MTRAVQFSEAVLPTPDGVLPAWPGEQVDDVHVRRGPRSGGEPALFRARTGPARRPTGPTSWGCSATGSRVTPVSLGPRAARTFPDARLLVLDDVGHVAQMERPEIVARAFLGMLDELAAGTPPAAP